MVAEGVEYGYQQQWLRKNNVDYLQGYQFLPPVTFDDFMRYYKQSVDLFESASDSTFQRKFVGNIRGGCLWMPVFLPRLVLQILPVW
jgi:hypothetical protein